MKLNEQKNIEEMADISDLIAVYYSTETGEFIFHTEDYCAVGNATSVSENLSYEIVTTISEEQISSVWERIEWTDVPKKLQETFQSYYQNSTTKKGDRNENEAANLLGRIRGSGNVSKVSTFTNHDPFRFADIIAIGSDSDVLFCQVKTNSVSDKELESYKRRMHRLNHTISRFEVWVRIDYNGWKIYRYIPDTDTFVCIITTGTDTEATVETLRNKYE